MNGSITATSPSKGRISSQGAEVATTGLSGTLAQRMDITCPQCKTEYEFDDAKVTEAGVTVKCTTCNFMFKVRRKAVVETEPVSSSFSPSNVTPTSKPWLIKTMNGNVLQFQELTTLQQWIVERRVSRDDRISKSGETWKRLGDIAELASFFQVIDATGGGLGRPPSRPVPQTAPPAPAASWAPSPQPASLDMEPTSLGVPAQVGEPAFTASTTPSFKAVGPSAAWEEGGVRLSDRHATVDVGEEELRRGPRRTMGMVALILVLLAGGTTAFLFRARLASLFGSGSSGQDQQALQNARKLFLLDDEDSLRQAELELSRGSATNGLREAALTEVLSTWASHLRDAAELFERQARALERSPGTAGEAKAMRLKASALRGESDQKLGQAGVHAKRALELGSGKGEVVRAMADYRRVANGSPVELRPLIADLAKKLPDDPEALFVEAAFWSSQHNTARAESLLKNALTKTRARYGQLLMRAAFFMAMLDLRADRRAEARAQARSIVEANPKHRWASQLIEVLDGEDRAAVASKANVPDPAPPTPATHPAAPATGEVAAASPAAGGTPKAATTTEAPATATYDQLVKQGNQLSEKGRTMQAFKLFERALKLRANGIEALVGMGYCHLDQERFAAAMSFFKRVLAIDSVQGDALIGMGEAYKVQGNFARALDFYRAYLQAHQSGPKAVMAKRNVADLERKVTGSSPTPEPAPAAPAPAPAPEPAPTPSTVSPTPAPATPATPESTTNP